MKCESEDSEQMPACEAAEGGCCPPHSDIHRFPAAEPTGQPHQPLAAISRLYAASMGDSRETPGRVKESVFDVS